MQTMGRNHRTLGLILKHHRLEEFQIWNEDMLGNLEPMAVDRAAMKQMQDVLVLNLVELADSVTVDYFVKGMGTCK
jgi:hypothetical protein